MKNFFTLALLFLSTTAFCQFDYQEDGAIRAVINKMFKGMQTGDTGLVRSCMHPNIRMQTAYMGAASGLTRLEEQPVDSFMLQMIRIREQQLPVDEKLLTCEIKTDVPMATAWTPYDFYVNGVKSHSGVNAFQLFKTSNGWKIIQICDTRRK